jgi:glycosyltransferase involved in cell wall biosynthesis
MKVALLPNPISIERPGGMQAQVGETLAALCRLGPEPGIEARLADMSYARHPDCDVLHAFGTEGSVVRTIDSAVAAGVPVVLSPRLSPAWSRANGTRARVADRVLGNGIACSIDSGYAQARRALQAASVIVASSEAERKAICDGFLIAPAKVLIVPFGIGDRFFDADPALFRERVRIAGRFGLMVGTVSPYCNQLGVARALAELAFPLVVIGDARERDAGYLRELRALRTVTCVGSFGHDDRMLASAYAAASVFVLASRTAGSPMTVAEALAAGTPVVSPVAVSLALDGAGFALRMAGWDDTAALKQEVSQLLDCPPPREAVRALVRKFTWRDVAAQLAQCYRRALAARGQAAPGG